MKVKRIRQEIFSILRTVNGKESAERETTAAKRLERWTRSERSPRSCRRSRPWSKNLEEGSLSDGRTSGERGHRSQWSENRGARSNGQVRISGRWKKGSRKLKSIANNEVPFYKVRVRTERAGNKKEGEETHEGGDREKRKLTR